MDRHIALSKIQTRTTQKAAAFPPFPAMVDFQDVCIKISIPFTACSFKIIVNKLDTGINLVNCHQSQTICTVHFINRTISIIIFWNDRRQPLWICNRVCTHSSPFYHSCIVDLFCQLFTGIFYYKGFLHFAPLQSEGLSLQSEIITQKCPQCK